MGTDMVTQEAQQALDAARQAVEELRSHLRFAPASSVMIQIDIDRIDEVITGLSQFLPLPNQPFPVPPVEVDNGSQ